MSVPDRLVAPQLYDVISGIGNNEMKGLVFGLMRDGISYTASPLHTRTLALQGDKPAWGDMAVGTPFNYCETFATVGVVAESTSEPLAFSINDLGKKLALPLLGHLLEVSLTEEPSLLGFHGPTATNSANGVRACQRRIEVMQAMRDSDGKKIAIANLASLLEIKIGGAGSIVDDLTANGIIEHESSGRGRATITYSAEAGLADVKLRTDIGSQLLIDIVDVLKAHFSGSSDPVSNEQIASRLITDYGYTDDKTKLIKKVAKRTNRLAEQRGVLKSTRDIEGPNIRGAVYATEPQLATIDNLLRAIDGIQKPNACYLAEGREKIEVTMSDYGKINHLISKARKDSAGLKRLPDGQQKSRNAVKSVVVNAGHPMSIREIQTELLANGVNLDRRVIRTYLGQYISLGSMAVEPSVQGDKYHHKPKNEQ